MINATSTPGIREWARDCMAAIFMVYYPNRLSSAGVTTGTLRAVGESFGKV
jgi:hypothetical protein